MKNAFPARAVTVNAVRPGPRVIAARLRKVTAVPHRTATAVPVANIARHVRKANIVRPAPRVIAARRAPMVTVVRPVLKASVATAAPLAVAAILPATVAAPRSGALRAKF
jgi:hypothetical protein